MLSPDRVYFYTLDASSYTSYHTSSSILFYTIHTAWAPVCIAGNFGVKRVETVYTPGITIPQQADTWPGVGDGARVSPVGLAVCYVCLAPLPVTATGVINLLPSRGRLQSK